MRSPSPLARSRRSPTDRQALNHKIFRRSPHRIGRQVLPRAFHDFLKTATSRSHCRNDSISDHSITKVSWTVSKACSYFSRMESTLRLFDELDRTYDGIADDNEDTFSFLNRSAWLDSEDVRNALEAFFERYPEAHRSKLKSRLLNRFEPTFFELFLHEMLLRLDCEVIVEPSLANTQRVPDFSARFSNGEEVIVEAAVVTDVSSAERARERRMEVLHRQINEKVASPDFFICLGRVTNDDLVPPSKDIVQFIRTKLAGLNSDTLSAQMRSNRYALPQWTYEGKSGFQIEISVVPRAGEKRGDSSIRSLGAFHGGVRWGGSGAALKKSIKDKCARYRGLQRTFVIAVNAISRWGIDQDDVDEALFGATSERQNRNGVWIGPQGPRNRDLSAVLVVKVWPWNIPSGEVHLFHNPFARHPCAHLNWKVAQSVGQPPETKTLEGITLKELFAFDRVKISSDEMNR
jgi:hypothetical protein